MKIWQLSWAEEQFVYFTSEVAALEAGKFRYTGRSSVHWEPVDDDGWVLVYTRFGHRTDLVARTGYEVQAVPVYATYTEYLDDMLAKKMTKGGT